MTKRKKKNTPPGNKVLIYIAWSLALIAVILSCVVAGYYFGYENAKEDMLKKEKLEKQKSITASVKLEKVDLKKSDDEVKKSEELAKKSEGKILKVEENINSRLKEILKKDSKDYLSAAHEFDDQVVSEEPKEVKRDVKKILNKPKLAIIIDDVSTSANVQAIKSLGIPLTMSFLPPNNQRPQSAILASKENFYMVHLPMEAQNFSAEEPYTLRIHDSQETITKRIEEIQTLFPRVKYINNHTGSKFTSNELAMNKFIYALHAKDISFIDSRTTAQTQAPKVMKNFGLNYVARDVFLDHQMDKAYIISQIKKAIKSAKLHGTAIAIGHPHANTLQALRESKKLLSGVDLVYVDKLY